jgi:hypothetical protein
MIRILRYGLHIRCRTIHGTNGYIGASRFVRAVSRAFVYFCMFAPDERNPLHYHTSRPTRHSRSYGTTLHYRAVTMDGPDRTGNVTGPKTLIQLESGNGQRQKIYNIGGWPAIVVGSGIVNARVGLDLEVFRTGGLSIRADFSRLSISTFYFPVFRSSSAYIRCL